MFIFLTTDVPPFCGQYYRDPAARQISAWRFVGWSATYFNVSNPIDFGAESAS